MIGTLKYGDTIEMLEDSGIVMTGDILTVIKPMDGMGTLCRKDGALIHVLAYKEVRLIDID